MAKLKMVAGQKYACVPVFGAERVLTVGEVFEVDDAQVDLFLEATFSDALNNTHHYFALVDDEPAASPKRRSRAAE